MSLVAIPDDETTEVLASDTARAPKQSLWIQNHNQTTGIWLVAVPPASAEAGDVTIGKDFFLAPAQLVNGVVVPATFITTDRPLVSAKWLARQNSGGSIDLNIGRF